MIELINCPQCHKKSFGQLADVEGYKYDICRECGWHQKEKQEVEK